MTGERRGRGRPRLDKSERTRDRSYSLRPDEHEAIARYAQQRGWKSTARALREILRPRLIELGLLQPEDGGEVAE